MSENTEPVVAVEETVTPVEEPVTPAEETAAAPAVEDSAPAKKAKKVKKVKKPRSVPLKIFMGLIAFILCIVMFAVSVVGMVILNLRVIVSENGISSIITQLITGPTASVPQRPALTAGLGTVITYGGGQIDEQVSFGSGVSGSLIQINPDGSISVNGEVVGKVPEVHADGSITLDNGTVMNSFIVDSEGNMVIGEGQLTQDVLDSLLGEDSGYVVDGEGNVMAGLAGDVLGDMDVDLDQVVGDNISSGGMDGVAGALVDWAYDYVQDQFGGELEISKEQVQNFVQNSTVKDFVAEKAAGLVQDFYSGESKTTITPEEISGLIKENAQILEDQFGLEITDEALDIVDQAIADSGFLAPIEENGLMGYIQQSMGLPGGDGDQSGDNSSGGFADNEMAQNMQAIQQAMEIIRTVTSYSALAILGGVMAFLMLLLFFVNGGISAMLSQTGVILTLTGLIFSAPAIVCQTQPALLMQMLDPMIASVVISVFTAAAWVNYTVLGVGVAMIVAAIVIKVIKNARKKALA